MRDPEFAFLQTAPRRLFVGWGPFHHAPMRQPHRPAFFISDFFLSDPHPWKHPASWEELSLEEFARRFPPSDPPEVEWKPLSLSQFQPLFDSARQGMERGEFNKIVPVMFETGHSRGGSDLWGWFASHLAALPNGMWAYGYAHHHQGLVGATPEVLFQSDGPAYRTMALAGTRPIARAAELLHDAKELREHRLVVEDIVHRLAPFGNVEVEPLQILELPTIAHLVTSVLFQESGTEKMTFLDMVRRLHPTAALGVFPRTEAGERWLREADAGVKRRIFGGPFGIEWPDHSSLALVAIRNVAWQGEQLRVGSGAGLLPESQLEREFEELREKREQVKALFGLNRAQSVIPTLSDAKGRDLGGSRHPDSSLDARNDTHSVASGR